MSGLGRFVGVMGGMFDPVHCGHLQAARAARACCMLDEVVLVPCGNPVHRQGALLPAAQRCAMLQLAIGDAHWLRLDSRECDSPAPSRTYDTLMAIRAESPENVLHFILGMDAFLSLAGWYRWREILDLVHLIVVKRPGYRLDAASLEPELAHACEGRWVESGRSRVMEPSGRLFLATLSTPAVSSTRVRDALRQGRDAAGLVPEEVASYIARHQLYQRTEHPI